MDVLYFIFIFISSSVPRFSMKKSVNQLIKNKRPKELVSCRDGVSHLDLSHDIIDATTWQLEILLSWVNETLFSVMFYYAQPYVFCTYIFFSFLKLPDVHHMYVILFFTNKIYIYIYVLL